jgi:hypothetical protein
MVELYLHSPILLHGAVLDYWSTARALRFTSLHIAELHVTSTEGNWKYIALSFCLTLTRETKKKKTRKVITRFSSEQWVQFDLIDICNCYAAVWLIIPSDANVIEVEWETTSAFSPRRPCISRKLYNSFTFCSWYMTQCYFNVGKYVPSISIPFWKRGPESLHRFLNAVYRLHSFSWSNWTTAYLLYMTNIINSGTLGISQCSMCTLQ